MTSFGESCHLIQDALILTGSWRGEQCWTSFLDSKHSIFVSVHQLIYGNFRKLINTKNNHYNIVPSQLIIELTESLFIEDYLSVNNFLKLIRSDGFSISLDDFGTGYSSLSF